MDGHRGQSGLGGSEGDDAQGGMEGAHAVGQRAALLEGVHLHREGRIVALYDREVEVVLMFESMLIRRIDWLAENSGRTR